MIKLVVSFGKGIGFILQKFPEPEHDSECCLNQKEWEELMINIRRWRLGMVQNKTK